MSTPLCQITHHKTNYVSLSARRSRCERRTSGVRRSKKLPADQNQLMEAVKDNRSFFVCLFRAMKPNQTTSICLLRAIKAQPTNFCLFVKSSQTRLVGGCSDSSILKQSEQNFFFLSPGLLLGLRLPLTYFVPHVAYLRRSVFSVEEWFCPFFYFSITPRLIYIMPLSARDTGFCEYGKYTIWFRPW